MKHDFDTDCPRCKENVDLTIWEDGACLNCGLEYFWEEFCTEDYSDCWPEFYFDKFDLGNGEKS